MPVQLRMIEEQLDALPVALVGQHFQNILLIGRRIDDVPVILLRTEHGEAIVMLAGDGDVLHARGFRQRDPFRRIVFGGIELRRQFLIFGDGHFAIIHDPFAIAEHAIYTPVNEHAEPGVLKPFARLQVGLGRLVSLACRRGSQQEREREGIAWSPQ